MMQGCCPAFHILYQCPLPPLYCRDMVAGPDSRVDFAMAEALALGTLALHRSASPKRSQSKLPGQNSAVDMHLGTFPEAADAPPDAARAGLNWGAYAVRLTGQDSERGTFNQRHAVLYDQINGSR